MEIQAPRVRLAALSVNDLPDIHQLHILPETDAFNTLGIPASIEETAMLLTQWIEEQKAPRKSFIYTIRLKEENGFIGLIALRPGKAAYKIAEVWYKVLPTYWRQGYTTEALIELLKFGFNNLGLHRIEAGCAVDNIASIRVLEKVGMTREGSKRKLLPIRGAWVDNYIYAILDTDF